MLNQNLYLSECGNLVKGNVNMVCWFKVRDLFASVNHLPNDEVKVANIFFVPPVHHHNNIPHLHHQTNTVLSFDFCCLSSTQVMFENKDDLRIILLSRWLKFDTVHKQIRR